MELLPPILHALWSHLYQVNLVYSNKLTLGSASHQFRIVVFMKPLHLHLSIRLLLHLSGNETDFKQRDQGVFLKAASQDLEDQANLN